MKTKLKPQLVAALAFALVANLHTAASGEAKAADDTAVTEMPPIQVRGVAETYKASKATTATKTDTPLIETPVSVQVVPKAVLEDQQVINLSDVYKNVSGMQGDFGYATWDSAFIRGFSNSEPNQNTATYRNGVRTFGRGGGLEEMSNVERVEVVKGPASVLYGRIEPGGLLNVVTKKPEASPDYSVQQQVGSYDFYRTTLDATGPVTQDKTLLYRVDGADQKSKGFQNFFFSDYTFIAPSMAWRLNANLEVNVDVESRRAKGPNYAGIPMLVPGVSRSLWLGDKTDNTQSDKDRQNFDWTYRINDAWTLKNGFGAYQGKTHYDSVFATSFDATTGDVTFSPWVGNNKVNAHSGFLELAGHFDGPGVKHETLFGVDTMSSTTSLLYFVNGWANLPGTFNVFNPVYGFADYAAMNAQAPDFFVSTDEKWNGAYAQDQITFGKDLHLLVGGRYDSTETAQIGTYVSPTQPKTTYSGFKPRVGLLYQTAPGVSVYGSYTESLGALNVGLSASGTTFKPEQAKQYEAGVKTESADGRWNSTMSVYQITKNNVISPDPAKPIIFNVASGEVRSRGLELDMSGKLTDRLSLIANYAHTDVVVTQDLNGFQGLTPANVAKDNGNVWAKYNVTEQLGCGGGLTLVSSRYGDSYNTFKLPGYGRWDAMMAYHFKYGGSKLSAQLNVNNILNKDYLAGSDHLDSTPYANIVPGTPRTFYASVKAEF